MVFELIDDGSSWKVQFDAAKRLRALLSPGMELVPSGINPFDRFHGLSTVSHIEMNTSWTHEAAAQPAVAITDMSTDSETSVSSIPSSPSDTVGSRANAPIDATGGCPEGVMGPEVLAQQQLLVKDTERVQTQLEGFSNLQRLMARPSCSIKAGDDKGSLLSVQSEGVDPSQFQPCANTPTINVQINGNIFVTINLADQSSTIDSADLRLLRGTGDGGFGSDRAEGVNNAHHLQKKSKNRKTKRRQRLQHDHKLALLHHRRRLHQSNTMHRRTSDHAKGVLGVEWHGGVDKEGCPVYV
jgi:hypothetical protein